MEPELPDLPMPDTASLAYSGRSVDYISGYEAGFEKAAAQMLQCYRMVVEAERERARPRSLEERMAAMEPRACAACSGTLRASTNGFNVFYRCDRCDYVPIGVLEAIRKE